MPRFLLRRFAKDPSGNFVILFAFALVPMLGLMGLGIDYSLALRAKTALDASTDAALLAAATEAMQIIQTQSTANYDATPVAKYYGGVAGQMVFAANSATVRTVTPATLNLQVDRQPGSLTITATGNYTAQSPTVFGKMFGTKALNTKGAAASSLNLPKYMNIYVATDISQSMGIASTQAYMDQLASLTGGCVFGCHVSQNASISNEQTAHNNNILLRIDVIKQAIQNMIYSASNTGGTSPTISIGLYTLQKDYATLSSPSTDYTTLQNIAGSIDLGPNRAAGDGDTNYPTSLNDFAGAVSASGDGSSTNSRQSFVFLMTDGVTDVPGNCVAPSGQNWGHCTGPFDYNLCTSLKSKGVTVGVIYTTYIPFPNIQSYRDLVAPFASQIPINLQKCASPGWYYEANEGPAIQQAINDLFNQAVSSGKLTQ